MSNVFTPNYAVIFRTHFWDQFASRQLERVRRKSQSGNVFVLVDETRGAVSGIENDRVVRITDSDILSAGFVDAGEGSIQWYSGDVPLYLFQSAHPDYDFYIQLEYDVHIDIDLDALVARINCEKADIVAFSNGVGEENWHWLSTCLDFYSKDEVRHQLYCFSVFSRRALQGLAASRLRQAKIFRSCSSIRWPYCEGFVATEARKQSLVVRELKEYGNTEFYDWWPPFHENETGSMEGLEFVHPVLDQERYTNSLLKYDLKLGVIASPVSWFHKKLRRLGTKEYVRLLQSVTFRRAFWRSFRQRFKFLPSSERQFSEMTFSQRDLKPQGGRRIKRTHRSPL